MSTDDAALQRWINVPSLHRTLSPCTVLGMLGAEHAERSRELAEKIPGMYFIVGRVYASTPLKACFARRHVLPGRRTVFEDGKTHE
jgi:hypothetical protein